MGNEIPTSDEVVEVVKAQVIPVLTGFLDAYKQLEQQLAQEKDNLAAEQAYRQKIEEQIAFLDSDIKEQNAAMRALLEEWLTALEDAGYLSFVYENRCRWCHSTTQHHDFCLLARSRAFLADHPA